MERWTWQGTPRVHRGKIAIVALKGGGKIVTFPKASELHYLECHVERSAFGFKGEGVKVFGAVVLATFWVKLCDISMAARDVKPLVR